MKKVLAIAVLGVFVLASCKKDYDCVCTSATYGNYTTSLGKQKKNDAEAACEILEIWPDETCTLSAK